MALQGLSKSAHHRGSTVQDDTRYPGFDTEKRVKTETEEASEDLEDAINDLIRRTSKRLKIPKEWKHRPIAFTRAYLGMEVK